MVLNEELRNQIDEVARRHIVMERINASVRGLLAMCAVYSGVRAGIGLLTGGQGGSLAFGLAFAAGVTFALTSPKSLHTRLTAARYIDNYLGLEDKLATTVERATLDNTSATRVEQWLFLDAANHASFINPDELVPYRLPRQSRWLIPLVIIGLALSFPIYPRGLSWQVGGTRLQQTAKRAGELLALANQLENMSSSQPELKQVANELRQVSEQLRDKRIPQDAALDLLRALEEEMQERPAGVPGGSSGEIDISQIQRLAERLRVVQSTSLPSSMSSAGRPSGSSGSEDMYGDNDMGSEMSDGDSSSQSGNSTRQGQRSPSRSDSGSPSGEGESGYGEESTDENSGEMGTNSRSNSKNPSGRNNQNSSNSGGDPMDEPGAGGPQGDSRSSQAGTNKGSNSSQTGFQRQTGLERELTPISGKVGSSGQLFTGNAQGNTPPEKAGVPKPTGTAPGITPKSVERAIEQESIPLAYQRWVKNYFAVLEPSSTK